MPCSYEGGPEEAMDRKINHCLEKNRSDIFDENEDPDQDYQWLEIVGKYGSSSTLFNTVQKFTANGSLFAMR